MPVQVVMRLFAFWIKRGLVALPSPVEDELLGRTYPR
jgi:hypothetical protein